MLVLLEWVLRFQEETVSKKDKKKEEKLAKKATKSAVKKAKKKKLKEIASKSEEMVKELRAAREAVAVVEEPLAEDVVAVVKQEQVEPADKKAAAYVPVVGDTLRTVSIKMPVTLIEAADKAAAAYGGEGVSRSEFIRLAIEKLVNE